MIDDTYLEMIRRLTIKTSDNQTVWNKLSRENEFSISFRSGALVIDKYFDSSGNECFCFSIYNDRGDSIYGSGTIEELDLGEHRIIKELHEIVSRRYHKVDETIQGFSMELENDGIVGKQPEPDPSPPGPPF